ncbi:hypothetical protein FACS1894217_05760 [Clostridia bacterium]|nr:hypothetical protein FACS1894217_05760 [Clostridia bacterium]
MFSYNFTLTTGDKNIGTVYLPAENTVNIPVIIYCHGWGGNRKLWTPTEKLCEIAVNKNIALVTFDFFGCGETGGDSSKITYARWKNNLAEIISWVVDQTFSDKNKIGIYAFSSGSTAALRLATEDKRIAFIVSVGTCISTHIGMGKGGPAKLFADNLGTLISGGIVNILSADFDINFYLDTISNAPIHTIDKIRCPVLFLQGTADNVFRCSDAKMAYEIMKQSNLAATHIEIKGGKHELDNVIKEAMNAVFDWLIPIL